MINELCFVIKKDGQYLDTEGICGPLSSAWKYHSCVVFEDADFFRGEVFLLFPNGREIWVSKEDFAL
jgi:hypothetical protein